MARINVKTGDLWILYFFRIGGYVAVLVALLAIIMGFTTLYFGAEKYYKSLSDLESKKMQMEALSVMVGSLEFFLFSALPYLVLRTLGNYCSDLLDSEDGNPQDSTLKALLAVKALVGGLMIAILSANMLTIYLSGTEDSEMLLKRILAGCAIVGMLILYVWLLEYFGHKDHGGDNHTEEKPSRSKPKLPSAKEASSSESTA